MHLFPIELRLREEPLPPSTMLAVELAGASLPNPELKRSFKFRGSPRGVVPAGQGLPQIIGVEHDREGLLIAEKFVTSLPKGVKVGVEFDRWQILDKKIRNLLVGASRSFSAIAAAAERTGHDVIFIERRSFQVPPNSAKQVRLLRDTAEEALAHQESPDMLVAIARRLAELTAQLGSGRGCSIFNATRTSAWRSELMARNIARVGNWSSSDVVIVGTAHAYNLARIFDTTITTVIGHYTSQEHVQSRLGEVMLEQVASHTTLQHRRALHKSLFSIRHPLHAWRNRPPNNKEAPKASTSEAKRS